MTLRRMNYVMLLVKTRISEAYKEQKVLRCYELSTLALVPRFGPYLGTVDVFGP